MTAYMIVYARVDDAAGFEPYVAAVGPLIQRFGGKLVARGVPPVKLEGDWPWGTAGVLEFASVEAAEAFWHSPEYTEVKALRAGVADFQVIVVPSLE